MYTYQNATLLEITCHGSVIKMTHPAFHHLREGDGDEMDVSFHKVITFICDSYQMAFVLSAKLYLGYIKTDSPPTKFCCCFCLI